MFPSGRHPGCPSVSEPLCVPMGLPYLSHYGATLESCPMGRASFQHAVPSCCDYFVLAFQRSLCDGGDASVAGPFMGYQLGCFAKCRGFTFDGLHSSAVQACILNRERATTSSRPVGLLGA